MEMMLWYCNSCHRKKLASLKNSVDLLRLPVYSKH